jgi:acyl-coenzyme A synthetase/AMP-(fatty) acid ligase
VRLLYTSGTTGQAEGLPPANGYFLRAGEWYLGLHELAESFPTPTASSRRCRSAT